MPDLSRFPSEQTRKNVLWWTIVFLSMLTAGLVLFGDDHNELHKMALDRALSLYAWLIVGVVLNTAVDAAVSKYFEGKASDG